MYRPCTAEREGMFPTTRTILGALQSEEHIARHAMTAGFIANDCPV